MHPDGGRERHEIPCVRAEAVLDPTGCGDAYRAGLLFGIALGWDWPTTGRLAAVMGALKIAQRGDRSEVPRSVRLLAFPLAEPPEEIGKSGSEPDFL